MPFTTYAELQTAIGTWLNREDLASYAPDFIALAETQLERDIRHWKGEKRATTTISTRFTAVPEDLLETIRLQISTEERPLQLLNSMKMHELRANNNDTAGIPIYYSVIDSSFEVYPTPADSYTGTLHYRATLPKLSDANTSNWLLETAPDAYLYASLLASAPFLQHDERLGTWSTLYLAATQALNKQSERATHGGNLRMRIA